MSIQPSDLLAQLTALIASVETDQTDAEHWRAFQRSVVELGYGPRITIDQIIALLPDPLHIASIVAHSQEETPSPSATPKSGRPRAQVTDDLRRQVHDLRQAGVKNTAICDQLGIAKSTVTRILADGRP